MSEITGTALRYDGLPVDYVSIFNWTDGKCIAQIIPDALGNWSYRYIKDLNVGITYVSDGCEPVTHGAYVFESKPWSPSLLFEENQGLWFDAADASSMTIVSDQVSSWNDKSGGNQHATQTSASIRPKYDAINKGVKATGIGERLNGLFGTIAPERMNEYTIFAVLTPLKTTVSSTAESNSGADFYSQDALHNVFFEPRSTSINTLGPVFSATTKSFVVTETKDGVAPKNIAKNITMASNGRVLLGVTRASNAVINAIIFGKVEAATKSQDTNIGWNTFSLPAQYTDKSFFNGSIHELILVHNGSMSLDDIQKTEIYLAIKWGVTNSLVAGHPGKT